jgi:hypothetical protein
MTAPGLVFWVVCFDLMSAMISLITLPMSVCGETLPLKVATS